MLNDDDDEQQIDEHGDGNNTHASASICPDCEHEASGLSEDHGLAMVSRVDEHLQATRVPIDQCVLANDQNTRAYALEMPADPKEPLPGPIPDDEAYRVEVISLLKLEEIVDVPELELICELAAVEMQCSIGLVSLAMGPELTVLASNADTFKRVSFPRNQTCCQHAIMTTQPLALRNLESDIRFQSLTCTRNLGVEFYCGFPLQAPCGTVVGTLCCFDQQSHEVSQSQYSSMRELVRTAGRILAFESYRRGEVDHAHAVQQTEHAALG